MWMSSAAAPMEVLNQAAVFIQSDLHCDAKDILHDLRQKLLTNEFACKCIQLHRDLSHDQQGDKASSRCEWSSYVV